MWVRMSFHAQNRVRQRKLKNYLLLDGEYCFIPKTATRKEKSPKEIVYRDNKIVYVVNQFGMLVTVYEDDYKRYSWKN